MKARVSYEHPYQPDCFFYQEATAEKHEVLPSASANRPTSSSSNTNSTHFRASERLLQFASSNKRNHLLRSYHPLLPRQDYWHGWPPHFCGTQEELRLEEWLFVRSHFLMGSSGSVRRINRRSECLRDGGRLRKFEEVWGSLWIKEVCNRMFNANKQI